LGNQQSAAALFDSSAWTFTSLPNGRTNMPTADVHGRFQKLKGELEASLVEREGEIECMLTGMIAQEHVLLVGDPGTAKSQLCRSVAAGIHGARKIERQVNKFTTPEELFGPVSVTSLKNDRYQRIIVNMLPDVEIAFLDEVFKASSAILNTMLSVMNERTFDNGGTLVQCPLRVMVGASNEWPVGEGFSELGALFDRFLIRKTVRPVTHGKRESLIFDNRPAVSECVTLSDIDTACTEAQATPFQPDAQEAYLQILDELHTQGIDAGDRRMVKGAKVAQASAWLAGSPTVEVAHLECLKDVLWSDPQEQPSKAAEIVMKIANPVGSEVYALLGEAEELLSSFNHDNLADSKNYESIQKLGECQKKLKKLNDPSGRAAKATDYIKNRVLSIQKKMMGLAS
jgi:MoxR-like ATPase